MISHRCKNCLFWDNQHVQVRMIEPTDWKPEPGICRKKIPSAYMKDGLYLGVQMIMDANEFCGEWKADKEDT